MQTKQIEYVMAEFYSAHATIPRFIGMAKVPSHIIGDIRAVADGLAGLSTDSKGIMSLKGGELSVEPIEHSVRNQFLPASAYEVEIHGDCTLSFRVIVRNLDGSVSAYQSEWFAVPTADSMAYADAFFDRMVEDIVMEGGRMQTGPLFAHLASLTPPYIAADLHQQLVCPS